MPAGPRGTALWVAAWIAAVALPRTTLACRCLEPRTTAAAYRGAALVVAGKVLEVTPRPEIDGFVYKVTVLRAWKRDAALELSISTGTDCRFEAVRGGEYLMYLVATESGLTTARCMGNGPLASRRRAVRWLDEHGKHGRVPTGK
jgi:hypothetical protein